MHAGRAGAVNSRTILHSRSFDGHADIAATSAARTNNRASAIRGIAPSGLALTEKVAMFEVVERHGSARLEQMRGGSRTARQVLQRCNRHHVDAAPVRAENQVAIARVNLRS